MQRRAPVRLGARRAAMQPVVHRCDRVHAAVVLLVLGLVEADGNAEERDVPGRGHDLRRAWRSQSVTGLAWAVYVHGYPGSALPRVVTYG